MSSPWLALDTATAWASVAVGWGQAVEAEWTSRLATRNAAALLPQIDAMLRDLDRRPDELGGVVVGAGPGSFTGVRVAAATAKALASARGLSLRAYPTLLALVAGSGRRGEAVGALVDAYGGALYGAVYRLGEEDVETLASPIAAFPEEIVERWRGLPLAGLVGEGARRHRAWLEDQLAVPVLPGPVHLPRAAALLVLAAAYPELGTPADPATWEPMYLHRQEPTWA